MILECDRKHFGQSYGRILWPKESYGYGRNDLSLTARLKGALSAEISSFGGFFSTVRLSYGHNSLLLRPKVSVAAEIAEILAAVLRLRP